MILFVTMIVTSIQYIHTQRSITTVTCELMYKLTHTLGKHLRRDFFAKVLFKLHTMVSWAVNRIATIRNISAHNLAHQHSQRRKYSSNMLRNDMNMFIWSIHNEGRVQCLFCSKYNSIFTIHAYTRSTQLFIQLSICDASATAFEAYSTWKMRPSGEKIVASISY